MTLAERIYHQTNRVYDRARSRSAIDAAHTRTSGRIDQLSGHRYCVLISYRRDGTPVASTLWFGLRDGCLYFRTGASTAKLTRIRRNPQVRVAPATVRGRPLGPPFVGRARILDSPDDPIAEAAIRSNYRWFRRIYLRLLTRQIQARYVEIIPAWRSAELHHRYQTNGATARRFGAIPDAGVGGRVARSHTSRTSEVVAGADNVRHDRHTEVPDDET